MKINLPFLVSFIIFIFGVIRFGRLAWGLRHLLPGRRIKLDSNLHQFIEDFSPYYAQLSPRNQQLFQRRVLKFIGLKSFSPKKGMKITKEMKILIASKAIQVTFGYPFVYLHFLDKIYVYPEAYKSETDYYYHGETSVDGHIKLSWKNFLEGELDPNDGISLGIHEFSHALHIENHVRNGYYLFINPYYLKSLRQGYEVLKEEILEYDTPIRKYGATNFPEFFAVCVEVFFENPQALYEYNKDLYELMAKILNQNTLELYA